MPPPSKRKSDTNETIDTAPAPKRTKYDYSKTVTLRVSKDAKHIDFVVPADVVCKRSKLIARHVGDSSPQIVHLPELCHHSCQAYLHWLYSSEIEIGFYEQDSETAACEHMQDDILVELGSLESNKHLRFYLIADYMEDVALKDSIMYRGGNHSPRCIFLPRMEVLMMVWAQVSKEAGIRRWMVDLFTTFATDATVQYMASFPADFLARLTARLLALRGKDVHQEFAKAYADGAYREMEESANSSSVVAANAVSVD